MTSAERDARARRSLGTALLVAVTGVLLVVAWRGMGAPDGPEQELTGLTMGTTYTVTVGERMSAGESARVRELVEQRLSHVDDLMTTYDSASELSRFNRLDSTEPVPASGDLLAVLTVALDVGRRSGGAFDVTVAPLVDAWGFGPAEHPARRPDPAELTRLLARVGQERLAVDSEAGTVAKDDPELRVDLSAIAKGYAVDRVARGLREMGYHSFLVEVGGELRASGRKRDGSAWRVGIERPEIDARTIFATLELADQAVATSGDYRSFFDDGAGRYAHIIDPRTGRAIPFVGSAVTVVASEVMVADAWATALSVLGPDEGHAVAVREGVAALFVRQEAGGAVSRSTPEFRARVVGYREVDGR